MKTVTLPCGESVPALGQGTWFLGDDPATRDTEVAALRAGIDHGMRLIDTAEMYGSGRAERLVTVIRSCSAATAARSSGSTGSASVRIASTTYGVSNRSVDSSYSPGSWKIALM